MNVSEEATKPRTSTSGSSDPVTNGHGPRQSGRKPSNSFNRHTSRFSRATDDSSQDPEQPGPEPLPRPEEPGPNAPPTNVDARPRRRVAHYAGLVLASMIGCLIRLGLEGMADYPGQKIFTLAWAQGVGCAIMGFSLRSKREISEFYPPLYTFLSTGVAGSVTTFSSWMVEGYSSFANFRGPARSGFYNSTDGFAYSFATFTISFGCLYFGEHMADIVTNLINSRTRQANTKEKLPSSTSSNHSEKANGIHATLRRNAVEQHTIKSDYFMILTAILSYLIALLLYFLAPTYWRHRATFPILLAPPGAILRFNLSNLNTLELFINKFPLGTFIANISGSLLLGGVQGAQYLSGSSRIALRCNALYAIEAGFCGCLTTVSTFMVESRSIKGKKWTWIYVGSSLILGHLAILVTFGIMNWTAQLGALCSG